MYYIRYDQVESDNMDDHEVTKVLTKFLDDSGVDYEEVYSEKKTLYVRGLGDSVAPQLAYTKRKSLDPSWEGMLMVDTLDGGREEYFTPGYLLPLQK
ncbi:hypothetical protein C492_00270 [Natronococcus jeotgali DSM 18795]|uniref:Uncharacterized protein n=2 Tax=Natronococcus jeotgali TaxID=413812 RepID=L9XZM5_9EURY|nr:hypothetical protein C492_00270 [Natronococcus jeotgali DSM 18795]